MSHFRVSDRELHTLLAALRHYQSSDQCDPAQRSAALDDLATNGGSVVALSSAEVDRLCEKINFCGE